MNSQSGWPVYLHVGLLSILTLLTLYAMSQESGTIPWPGGLSGSAGASRVVVKRGSDRRAFDRRSGRNVLTLQSQAWRQMNEHSSPIQQAPRLANRSVRRTAAAAEMTSGSRSSTTWTSLGEYFPGIGQAWKGLKSWQQLESPRESGRGLAGGRQIPVHNPEHGAIPPRPGFATRVAVQWIDALPVDQWVKDLGRIAPGRSLVDWWKGVGQTPVAPEVERRPGMLLTPPVRAVAARTETPSIQASRTKKEGHRSVAVGNDTAPPRTTVTRAEVVNTTWPNPTRLVELITDYRSNVEFNSWARETNAAIDRLLCAKSLGDEMSRVSLGDLYGQRQSLDDIIARTAPGQDLTRLRIIGYELDKRLATWTAAHQISRGTAEPRSDLQVSHRPRSAALKDVALRLDRDLATQPDRIAWREYLALPEVLEVMVETPDAGEQEWMAREILGRIDMAEMTPTQRELLEGALIQEYRQALVTFVEPSVDLPKLLKHLELYEQQPWDRLGDLIVRQSIELGWASDPFKSELSQQIQTHYRNANFRVVISEQLMNRMLPESMRLDEPVTDHLLGARVRGTSHTTNNLSVDLVPDHQRLHVELLVQGNVASRTRASKGLFVFHNRGRGRFRASKGILFGPRLFKLNDTVVTATNRNQVTSVESDLDPIPLVGWFARSLAWEEQEALAPVARRLVESKMARSARERFDQTISAQLASAKTKVAEKLIDPLATLNIYPESVEMQTTETQAIARYRLAGIDQMSAASSRPQEMPGSLFSVQVHESAINNVARRLDLGGKMFDLDQLHAHLEAKLGRPLPRKDTTEHDIRLMFAPTDAVEVDFEDGVVQVTLRLSELRMGRANRWKLLQIQADYVPRVRGLEVELARVPDRPIRVSGRNLRFRDQMPIRTIFNKVFTEEEPIQLNPGLAGQDERLAGLAVSQFVIRNGWIGMSVNEAE